MKLAYRTFSILFAALAALIVVLLAVAVWLGFLTPITDAVRVVQTAAVGGALQDIAYTFNNSGILNESATDETTSPYWWLNSGAQLLIHNDVGSTIQGALPPLHRWRLAYASSNAADTGNGYYPQNLFRLLSRGYWSNPRLEASFRVMRDNLAESPSRNQSNGLFLMSRYLDQNNLYYAGIRVDGHAIIKKKYRGIYYTLGAEKIFDGTYDRVTSPNLLPHSEWIMLESETLDGESGTVSVTLSMRRPSGTQWTQLVSVTDDGRSFGGPAIRGSARVGIRTDFMDIEFDNVRVAEIPAPGRIFAPSP